MDLPVFMPRPIPHKRQAGGGRCGYWLLQTSPPHGRPYIWTPWLPWDPSSSGLLDVSTQASTSNPPQHTGLTRAPPFINAPAAPTCPGFLVHLVFPLIEGSAHGNKKVLRNGENREEKPNFHQNHNPPRMEAGDREFGLDIHALLCLKQRTTKVLPCSTGGSVQCCVGAWMAGKFGGEWIHVYVWLSLLAVHLKLLQHCSLAIPQHKIKSFKKTPQCSN